MIKTTMISVSAGLVLGQSAWVYASDTSLLDDASMSLGSIVVSAQSGPLTSRSISTSVDILGSERIEKQSVNYTWQLYDQLPGVQLTQYGMGNESGKISFRGFNGEGGVNAVKLLIDGIPSNQHNGNMPYLELLTPLEIEQIEVVRGTNDPRYDLHNIAGNTDIITKLGGNYNTVRATYGSFATRTLQFVSGIESGEFTQNYSVSYHDSHRYRQHSDIEKETFSGKWFYTPVDGNFQAGVIARYGQSDAEESGYLTTAETRLYDEEKSRPHNSGDGGDRAMYQLSAHLDIDLSDALSWSSKIYRNELDEDRYLTYRDFAGSRQRLTKEAHEGVMSTLTWRPEVDWAHEFTLSGGVSAEFQDNESRRYNIDDNKVRTNTRRDAEFDFDIYGAFVQAIYKPTSALKVVPAYRISTVRGSIDNNLAGYHQSILDYGNIHQPKLSAVYSFNDRMAVYANWGKTFQIATEINGYKLSSATGSIDPSINEGWELGLKFTPTAYLNGRISVWQQFATGELKRPLGDDQNNEFVNVGKTRRQGIDLQLNAQITEQLGLWFAGSLQDSEVLKPGAGNPERKGNAIDHVPNYIVDAGIDYQVMPKLSVSSSVSIQDDSYRDPDNTLGKFGDFVLVNASASYVVSPKMTVDLSVKNLFDREYEYVWRWSATETMHSQGDGRAIFGSVQYNF